MRFEDIRVGQTAESRTLITDQMLRTFADLTGDHNPIHLDEAYAATTRFQKRIAHGILSLSQIAALFANHIPGPGSIYVEQTVRFRKPVFINDEVLARIEVTELIPEKRLVKFKTQCLVKDEVVLDGAAVLKLE